MSEKVLNEQLKLMEEMMYKVQKEKAEKAEPLEEALWEWEMKGEEETEEYIKLKEELQSIRNISPQTVNHYYYQAAFALKKAHEQFGITHWKDLTPQHTKEILLDRIHNGQRISSLKSFVHSLNFIQNHINSSHLFENDTIKLTNHEELINILKGQK